MEIIWERLIYNNNDYGDYYLVSNTGKIKNAKTGHVRKPYCNGGYFYLILSINGNQKTINVHRAVACTFVPNPYNLPQVNHIDGDKSNNCVENLEWVTAKDNCIHAVINDLFYSGERSELSKLNAEQIKYIKEHCIPYDENFGCTALAKQFNVDKSTISKIIHGFSWKEYTDNYKPVQCNTYILKKEYKCKHCNEIFIPNFNGQVYCSKECHEKDRRKVERPSSNELLELIKTTSFVKIGLLYGVSDNAIRKWCKLYGLPYKQKDIKNLINNEHV